MLSCKEATTAMAQELKQPVYVKPNLTCLLYTSKDSQEGYVNLFLHPLLDIYKDMSHSYIIELKYAKGKDLSLIHIWRPLFYRL